MKDGLAMSRPNTELAYSQRIGRVISYIHDHLDEEIGLDVLADIACMSPFHWHRIYTAMQGETVAATVRRLRMVRAADWLANTDALVASIAKRAGYTTSEAFGRAFRGAYGQPPESYREDGSHARFKAANRQVDATGFPVTIELLADQRCAAVSHFGSYMLISKAMGQVFDRLGSAGLLNERPQMIGVYFDDPDSVPVDQLRSKACVPVDQSVLLPAMIEDVMLSGGAYAKLRYEGPYADMVDAYRWLLGVWLPQSGHQAANKPIFEAYLNSPAEVPPTELLTDICLPLERTA
jgi:AraC family transcriptional regulator